jgi:hypothetical protein
VSKIIAVVTPLWAKREGETHTPKSGKLESYGTPENTELDCRGQISLHLSVLGVIGKVLKCRCPKWPRMIHLDICSPSYGQKKGRESNWQFDSRPLKVGNRPLPDVRWQNATWCWKALEESYNFGLDLVPIRGQGETLCSSKVPGLQHGTVSGLLLGSLEKKSHLDVASAERCRVYYMGEGGGFPESGPWWVKCVKVPVACPDTQGCSRMWINLLVVGFGCRFKLNNLVPLPSQILGLLAHPFYPL